MKFARSFMVAASLAVAVSMGACGHHKTQYVDQYDVECDAGDYIEHDDDCGYSDNGVWYYYNWAQPGRTSYAPYGWTPPAGVKTHYKTKKVKNPNPKVKAPKTPAGKVTNPKVTQPKVSNPKYTSPNKVANPPKVVNTRR